MPNGLIKLPLSGKTQRRLRTGLRLMMLAFAILCLLGATAFWIVTRSWFMTRVLTPHLEKRLGGEVTIADASYQGDGRVVFRDVMLRAPGVDGAAGEITHIATAVVTIDGRRLLNGSIRVTGVEVDRATLRLSEDRHNNGLLNVWALKPDWSDRNVNRMPAPFRVKIQNTAIEFGFHDEQGFHLLGSRLVSGEMRPTPGAPNLYSFFLSEVDPAGVGIVNGINMKGEWDAHTNEISNRIDGIELDDRVYRMCPQMVRALWESMNLQGMVESVEMHWHPDQSFYMQMAIENIALTMPVETNIQWARYRDGNVEDTTRRPRMHFNSGTIRMTDESLELLDMVGAMGSSDRFDEVVEVPYRITFSLPKLPPLDWEHREQWVQNVLKYAPFSMQYKTEDLRLLRDWRGEVPAIDLPVFIANVLERFQVSDCVLTTSLDVTRPEAVADESGDLIEPKALVNGSTYLHNASGRYQKFPYRLENVDAYLQFDNEKVTVHYLTGTGSGDSKLRISGEIKPPDNDAQVALRLNGENVPVDDRLREALHGNELAAFDMMFNKAAGDSLAAAGLLPDEASIEQARIERDEMNARVEDLRKSSTGDPALIAALESQITRLTRSIDAGAFRLGGVINIDLNIDRNPGRNQPTITTGTIAVQNVGLLYDRFPYPLRVTSGTLDWRSDRVTIVNEPGVQGLTLITPGGGQGTATGELLFHKDEKGGKFLPDLHITIDDDSFNDSVYAAIPMSGAEREGLRDAAQWPGRALAKAAQFVKGLGLRGSASYRGRINADENHRVNYNFLLSLNQCTAEPTEQLAHLVGASGPLWPAEFTIGNVTGAIQVSRDEIKIEQITGVAGESDLTVNGAVDMADGAVENLLNIQLQNLALDPNVLNLARGSQFEQARDIWRRYEPRGTYDAALQYHAKGPDASFDALLTPRTISIVMDGQARATLTRREGEARVRDGFIEFHQLLVDVENDRGISEGSLRLNGMCNIHQGAESFAIQGQMTGARMEAGYVAHLLRLFAGDSFTQQYLHTQPVGSFDAAFDGLGAAEGGPPKWNIEMTPKTVGFQWNDRPVLTTIEGGTITFDAARITLNDVRGRHTEGEFVIGGEIKTTHPVEAQLTINHSGQVRSDLVEAFLPPAALSALDHMKFLDFGPTSLENATLSVSESATDAETYDVAFSGPIRTTSASLDPGVPFHGVEGIFQIEAQSSAGALQEFNVTAMVDSAQALGQGLSSIEALVTLSDDGKSILMPMFRAESEDGAIAATASMQIQEHGEYQVNIDLVDVPLNRLGTRGDSTPSALSARAGQGSTSGDLFANLAISGRRGDPQSRTGRGVIRVMHGKMVDVPLLMQLMQVVQLSVPLAGNFNFADAQVYVEGDRVVFERILFESTMGRSSMLQLFGEGEMNFETLELNTRFHSRGSTPILRDIMGEIGDVLYCIEVTGPLGDPKARIVPLPNSN
jgi:hypothetical protein